MQDGQTVVTVRPEDDPWPRLSPARTGLRGRCPRCGRGHLFNGFLSIAPKCDVCGLEFSFADPADGPAFFVMTFFCLPGVFLGVWLEVGAGVSYLTNALITVPVLLVTCILPLRPLKGWLVASQYVYKAQQGELVRIHTDAPSSGF
jgi:uncharacterized protein (DUF983 family)